MDIVILKSFDPLKKYATTMGEEDPAKLNIGAIVTKPDSPFIWLIYLNYYNYVDVFGHNGLYVPMNLSRQYPDLIHVEEDSMAKPGHVDRRWVRLGPPLVCQQACRCPK